MLNSSSLSRVRTLAGGAGSGDVNFRGSCVGFSGVSPLSVSFRKVREFFGQRSFVARKLPKFFFQASGVVLAFCVALADQIATDEAHGLVREMEGGAETRAGVEAAADGLDEADLRISGGLHTAGADRRTEGTELAEADGVAVAGSGDDLGLELVEDGETVGLRHGASGADVLGDRLEGEGYGGGNLDVELLLVSARLLHGLHNVGNHKGRVFGWLMNSGIPPVGTGAKGGREFHGARPISDSQCKGKVRK